MSRGNTLAMLYTILLFLFLVAAAAVIIYLLKKKKKNLAVLLLIFTIIFELILFNLSLYHKVTLPRENTIFAEKPTPYFLPQTRILNLISDDVFNNFRPALYKKHVVSSSYTIYNQDYLDSSTIAKVYILLQDFNRKGRIFEAMDKFNIRQFINYGLSNFDNFSIEEKVFITQFLQAAIEGFMVHKDFYQGYININEATGSLIKNTTDYRWFMSDSQQQSRRLNMQEGVNLLFSLPFSYSGNYKSGSYAIFRTKEKDINTQGFYNFIYDTLSARQYFLFLFEYGISDEHTFVVLRDYYELINANSKYKKFRGYNTLFSNHLLKVLGVTAPIVRFYPYAEFAEKSHILSNLSDLKSKKDILYIEAERTNSKSSGDTAGESKFSYKVLRYNPNILELQYSSSLEGYLYFSDSYDNYWNAYVDGAKTTLYKANIAFKAIKIPQGDHKVSFIYDPKYFRISLWCYYLVFAACAVYLLIGVFINMRKG
ncbi:MAG: YfhO family protein [Candidatus Omnitrophica bacterium]|nr:YfhO family protein [Candidatus Omnitrophota bacterium]